MNSEFDLTANFAKFGLHGTSDRKQWASERQKMIQIIANIKAESKKAGYNPETDTNWCHLPMELRDKCIKEMNFRTRTRMRASSSIEKSYVDAHVYHFDKAIYDTEMATVSQKFWNMNHLPVFTSLKFFKSDPLASRGEERVSVRLAPILFNETYVNTPPFKFCQFKKLQCNMKSSFLPVYLNEWVTEGAPFRFKTLRCKGGNLEIFEYFLKNSWDGVEEIDLDLERRENFSFDSILCPSFIKAKTVFIVNVPLEKLREFALNIMKKWAEYDVEIGTFCHLHTGKIGETVFGEKRSYERKMKNDSKTVVIEENLLTRHRYEGEVIMRVVRKDPRPTDAPNGN